MNTKPTDKWLVDLTHLTCLNTETNMVIAFEKNGKTLKSIIKNFPLQLAEKWAKDPNGSKFIRKAVIEADEAFFRAYFEREIEEKSDGVLMAV